MFDEIDRIFVNTDAKKRITARADLVWGGWRGGVEWDRRNGRSDVDVTSVGNTLKEIRTTKDRRKDLEKICLKFKNGVTTAMQKEGVGFGKYLQIP
jgi:hypothetical protein